MRLLIICFILIAAFTKNLSAQTTDADIQLNKAQTALSSGDYKRAYKLFKPLAQKNNPLAMFSLALFHQNGWGRPIDSKQACQWFEKAAEGNITAAQHFFAECLINAPADKIDSNAAIGWYLKAAEAGHLISLCSVAKIYIEGLGIDKNPIKGLSYCQTAADNGITAAQIKMAKFLLSNDADIYNPNDAMIWLEKAASKHSIEAYYYLGLLNQNHKQNDNDALYWFEKAASEGYAAAYYPTARLYFQLPASHPSGKPEAAILAKTYLWLSAAQQQNNDPEQKNEINNMLIQVNHIIPPTWIPELKQKVNAHITQYHTAHTDKPIQE